MRTCTWLFSLFSFYFIYQFRHTRRLARHRQVPCAETYVSTSTGSTVSGSLRRASSRQTKVATASGKPGN